MRTRLAGVLLAGFVCAAALAGIPAHAANSTIAAQSLTYSWNPSSVTITVGDSVTWTTDGVYPHNVCVQKPGTTGTTCDEFRNGPSSTDWSSYANTHTFTTPGTYTFYCETHKSLGMTGTITVEPSSTGTGTTSPSGTQPTDTTTAPTQTQSVADTTAPAFTGRLRRRASRRALVVELGASEDATLELAVFRRAAHAHSFSRVGQASLKVRSGRNVVTVPRRAAGRLRSGSYRVRLQLVDAARNRSATRTLSFKLA